MQQAEFRMITDVASVSPKELRFNYEEIREFLSVALKDYENLVVTENEIPTAKEARAKCNKIIKTINDYRISIKKQLMEQYDNDFKPKCDELVGMAQRVADNIGGQLNAYDEQRKAEKLAGLRAYFDDNIGTLAPYLSFEQVQNPKWGNVTYTVEQAQQEIAQAMDMCADGVDAIRGLGSEFEATLLTAYAKNHDLAAVMKMNGELAETKKREAARREAEEARRREAEAARKEAEEREKARQEAARAAAQAQSAKYKLDDEPAPAQEQTVYQHGDVPKENVYTLSFRVRATRSQLVELRAAFDRIGIWFEKIEG